ncbi:EpsG family protein [Poseidonibacter lekithochrous]|uniref:EpsG family protein n=1 Tax=Poseidonibacter TaxID=2321187 RepID=UPI001C09998A|nr:MULTISPECIES: EpsG family protein [Poseidonibacter]MBU3015744.1 EpsG family protein [Poseidonibacter lekithochrous]MDO6829044.1 EpsG family protein [Poseidonibacter sp. 1_MG-2023]
MITYFIMFLIPAFLAINNRILSNNVLWLILGIVYSMIIGLRFEIGGDWFAYLHHYVDMQYYTYQKVLLGEDQGYFLLNFIIYQLDFGIGTVNLVCAAIFMYGLITFARHEDNPWMVIAVAVPYTITVVSMGYTRQAVALGFVLWALVYLRQNKMLGFFILVILATTFHKSAVLMIGLGIFSNGGGKLLKMFAVGIIGFGVWDAFLSQYQDRLIQNYVTAQMQSSGAYIRTFMNLIPAIFLILYRKRWKELFNDFGFWFIIALLSIFSFAIVGFASTAVDRMALYLIPIQLVVWSRLAILMSHQFSMSMVNLAIITYYSLVLYVWLNFAAHAYLWVPYQNILFHDLW